MPFTDVISALFKKKKRKKDSLTKQHLWSRCYVRLENSWPALVIDKDLSCLQMDEWMDG